MIVKKQYLLLAHSLTWGVLFLSITKKEFEKRRRIMRKTNAVAGEDGNKFLKRILGKFLTLWN